jgi:hypothetical protein
MLAAAGGHDTIVPLLLDEKANIDLADTVRLSLDCVWLEHYDRSDIMPNI